MQDLARRAGVARSTFYEHFNSRDDVLRESMHAPLQPLVDLAGKHADVIRTTAVLQHFREAGPLPLALLNTEGGMLVRDLLAEMIDRGSPRAYAIAGAQISIIAAWLSGKDKRNAESVAKTLATMTLALKAATRS